MNVNVDIEGINGIYIREQVSPSKSCFNEGKHCMTADNTEQLISSICG